MTALIKENKISISLQLQYVIVVSAFSGTPVRTGYFFLDYGVMACECDTELQFEIFRIIKQIYHQS